VGDGGDGRTKRNTRMKKERIREDAPSKKDIGKGNG